MLVIILFCIIAAESIILSIALQGIPNDIQFTAVDNFGFYIDLFSVNPSAAFKLALIDNPVFIFQQLSEVDNSQIWGLYFMPIQIVSFIALSFLTIRAINLKFNAYRWSQFFIASSLLLFAILYLRVQTCCTSSPRWGFDIWLISQITDPQLNQVFWENIYTQLAEHFTLIQFCIATTGLISLYLVSYTNLFNRNTTTSL